MEGDTALSWPLPADSDDATLEYPVENPKLAIWLGCVRKHMAMLNRQLPAPIRPASSSGCCSLTSQLRPSRRTYFRDLPGGSQDYADQRYYNANYGRFWTPGPKGMGTADPKDPGSWNRYSYAYNDPLNDSDLLAWAL